MEQRRTAGWPKDSKDRALRQTPARKLAAVAAAQGSTPLDVMLAAMRHYAQPGPDGEPLDRDRAVAIAEKAAPYVHAKLAQVDAAIRADLAATHRLVMMGTPEAVSLAEWEKQVQAHVERETEVLKAKAIVDPVRH